MQALTGTGVALITPFKENNSIDLDALARVVQFSIAGGVEYLVVLGTTAENATLTCEEKELVLQTVKTVNAGRLPLVIGIGGNNTAKIIEELKTRDFSGFTAILSVSPYYSKPTQEGIYQHYKAISQVSPLPILLYNVPGRTSSNILPSTVLRLANDCDNIIGIKEASGDLVQAMQPIQQVPKNFLIISGDDAIALPVVLAGGSGVISVIGQGFPADFSEMIRLGLSRKVDEAFAKYHQLARCIEMIFEQGNPAGIKQVLCCQGLTSNEVRLPLVKVDEMLAAKINNFVQSRL